MIMTNGSIINGSIDENVPPYLASQGIKSVPVSVMKRLASFPMIQDFTHNATLGFSKEDFHGLKEFNVHMDMYSGTHPILHAAWQVIKSLAPKNPFLEMKTITVPALGKVGLKLLGMQNYAAMFGIQPSDAADPSALAGKLGDAPSLPSSIPAAGSGSINSILGV